jgi:hypothetical protein
MSRADSKRVATELFRAEEIRRGLVETGAVISGNDQRKMGRERSSHEPEQPGSARCGIAAEKTGEVN